MSRSAWRTDAAVARTASAMLLPPSARQRAISTVRTIASTSGAFPRYICWRATLVSHRAHPVCGSQSSNDRATIGPNPPLAHHRRSGWSGHNSPRCCFCHCAALVAHRYAARQTGSGPIGQLRVLSDNYWPEQRPARSAGVTKSSVSRVLCAGRGAAEARPVGCYTVQAPFAILLSWLERQEG